MIAGQRLQNIPDDASHIRRWIDGFYEVAHDFDLERRLRASVGEMRLITAVKSLHIRLRDSLKANRFAQNDSF